MLDVKSIPATSDTLQALSTVQSAIDKISALEIFGFVMFCLGGLMQIVCLVALIATCIYDETCGKDKKNSYFKNLPDLRMEDIQTEPEQQPETVQSASSS